MKKKLIYHFINKTTMKFVNKDVRTGFFSVDEVNKAWLYDNFRERSEYTINFDDDLLNEYELWNVDDSIKHFFKKLDEYICKGYFKLIEGVFDGLYEHIKHYFPEIENIESDSDDE